MGNIDGRRGADQLMKGRSKEILEKDHIIVKQSLAAVASCLPPEISDSPLCSYAKFQTSDLSKK